MHFELLTHYSPFFRAALTGSFKEASEKLVSLPDTETEVFELFVHWLYHQRFPTEVDSPQLLALYEDKMDPAIQCRSLVKLYIFCDKYDVPQLQRQCLDAMFRHINDEDQLPSLEYVSLAFDSLEDEDPLCRMFVDAYCYWSDGACWVIEHVHNLPFTFLAKTLCQYSEFTHGGRDLTDTPNLCNYHVHATVEERIECEKKTEKDEAIEMLTR